MRRGSHQQSRYNDLSRDDSNRIRVHGRQVADNRQRHRGSNSVAAARHTDADSPLVPYSMHFSSTGMCMVFNNVNFRRGSPRHGSDKDYDSICRTFSKFGFSVVEHRDTTKGQMMHILTETAKSYNPSWKCFVCFFLSHGKLGEVMVDVENNDVSISELVRLLDGENCKPLRGKPKLFFVQMCRGNVHMPGVETDGTDDEEQDMLLHPPVPVNQDCLIAYCTTTGYYAYRDPARGSRFIQTLTEVLQERGHTDDILKVMTQVTSLVGQQGSRNRKMCPFLVSTLVRPLTFTLAQK